MTVSYFGLKLSGLNSTRWKIPRIAARWGLPHDLQSHFFYLYAKSIQLLRIDFISMPFAIDLTNSDKFGISPWRQRDFPGRFDQSTPIILPNVSSFLVSKPLGLPEYAKKIFNQIILISICGPCAV